MNTTDTIAAPASAVGGAITVIRISGPEALAVGNAVWKGRKVLSESDARMMKLGKVGDEPVLAVYMKSPASYTGDDVVELQCHGGAAAAAATMKKVLAAGARSAEPGEFTYRAFANGRIDLTQAEAVADLIEASGEAAYNLAARQLGGALGDELNGIIKDLTDLRSYCEARLDFPDEELSFDDNDSTFDEVQDKLRRLLDTRDFADKLHDGIEIALAGRPNTGKSSLLNRLAGTDRAIVSSIPGTTRDTVDVRTVLRNLPMHLVDTAGIRESEDPVEKLGIERSRECLKNAHVVLWILDLTEGATDSVTNDIPDDGRVIAVWNKCDAMSDIEIPSLSVPTVVISAKTGQGIEKLLDAISEKVFGKREFAMPDTVLNARCAAALDMAQTCLAKARGLSHDFPELAATELATAIRHIGEATGKNVDPDILDNIFSNFCIGK
ncbi:MAG: tRNA uridine-5-carboxymethylaminomethyl(34) synthesis GTPase MnmE [Victivallaceae bacterium]|nr:tRNA uridine-5-carboxymethylaminomethyl(34) synthesis GTPase MnmE [Victivallaceae bacterium]